MKLFRVLFVQPQNGEEVMGWGVQFPHGECYVDWNQEAFAEGDRLNYPHISQYGSLEDVRRGSGGEVVPIGTVADLRQPNARTIASEGTVTVTPPRPVEIPHVGRDRR